MSYIYIVTDLETGDIREELPLTSFKFGRVIGGAAGWTAKAPLFTPGFNKFTEAVIGPGRSAIWVMKNGVTQFGGIIWSVQANVKERTIQLGGSDHWSYFSKRFLTSNQTFTDVDQFQIVRDLLAVAQNNSINTIGYTASSGTSGVNRTVEYLGDDNRSYTDMVSELANKTNGFDFTSVALGDPASGFTAQLQMANRIGIEVNVTFQLGKNIESLTFSRDAWDMGNHIIVTGRTTDPDGEIIPQIEYASDAPSLNSYPQLDLKRASPLQGEGLDRYADALLLANKTPREQISMTVRADDTDAVFGSYSIGDDVRVIGDYGYATFDGRYRILSMSVEIDDRGKETITLNLTDVNDTVVF